MAKRSTPSNNLPALLILLIFMGLLFNPHHSDAGRTVRAGIYNFKPLVYSDTDGTPKGVYVEILNHVARQEGWNVQYVPGTWQEGLDRLKSNQIDLLLCIGYTPERARFLDFPNEFLLLDWGLVYRSKGSSLTSIMDLEGKTVAMLKGSVYSVGFMELVEQFQVTIKTVEMNQVSEVFKAVDTGRVDAGVTANIPGILNETGHNVERTPIIFTPVKIGYGVNGGRNADLIAALDRSIVALKADKSSLYYHEIGQLAGKPEQKIPKEVYWIVAGIASALVLAVGLIVVLRRQVQSKTVGILEAADQYNCMLQSTTDGFWRVGSDGRLLDVNSRYEQLSGFSRDELIGMAVEQLDLTESDADVQYRIKKLTESGFIRFETKHKRKDGFVWDVEVTASHQSSRNEMIVFLADISSRKSSEQLLKNALNDLPLAVALTDNQQEITYRNKRFVALFGYTENDIKTVADWWLLAYPDEQKREWAKETWGSAVAKAFDANSEVETYEYQVTCKNGQTRLVEISGVPLSGFLLATFNDVTERKQAEEERQKLESQLHQSQKMESIGRLAGGVAHDFNNMLGVILGHAEMGLMHLDSTHPVCDDLKEITKAAERSADLAQQLLTFARKQMVTPKVIDLNDTVTNILKMLQRLIGEDIQLDWHPSNDKCQVMIDPTQIDQILANLCVNARDAIPDTGQITIETGICTIDAVYCTVNTEATPGDYVHLVVSDTGNGMGKETLAHIFEPFYTTKEIGKGTGLGLATVYGAVKQNNGFINIYSEPGKGTTISIYLPHFTGVIAQEQTEDAEHQVLSGQETILLVEDESAILDITSTILEMQGYTVLRAATPGLAIELAREHNGSIHLLMTDVIMPEMNGHELARNILTLHPGMKRLFMSGYTADIIAHHGVLDDGVHFLQKPFSLPTIAAKVREVLDSN